MNWTNELLEGGHIFHIARIDLDLNTTGVQTSMQSPWMQSLLPYLRISGAGTLASSLQSVALSGQT